MLFKESWDVGLPLLLLLGGVVWLRLQVSRSDVR